ncbi:hypothetical protein BDN67DRAFT_955753 [Paxillus ammoniavirescens]|nr:hypothetical protein BDN67DRAFT_955753 [Paxillus ammoniavirescens]
MSTINIAQNVRNAVTVNYPRRGDTTSSGGCDEPDTFDPAIPLSTPSALQQTMNGMDLHGELEDAKQGVDKYARRAFQQEQIRLGEASLYTQLKG